MSDLISRQAAIDAVHANYDEILDFKSTGRTVADSIEDIISNLSSAQPERPRGKWLLSDEQRREDTDNGNYLYFCSNCLRSDIHAKTQEVPFCWWCGADMRGGDSD